MLKCIPRLVVFLVGILQAQAASIFISNGSFESPTNDFASPEMGAWQKAPQPVWYSDPQFPWFYLTGEFLNTSNGAPDHIDNMDRRQGAFFFAVPQVAIFQDYNSIAGSVSAPSREFNAQFEAGKSYTL